MDQYDMYVDVDTLNNAQLNLKKISLNLQNSSKEMQLGLSHSGTYLSGRQFEIVKETTDQCIKLVENTTVNIEYAIKYLQDLEQLVIDYNNCQYKGDYNG